MHPSENTKTLHACVCMYIFKFASAHFPEEEVFLSSSPFAQGFKLPCYWGGFVLSAPGLDASFRETQRIQDLHPKMYANIMPCKYYYLTQNPKPNFPADQYLNIKYFVVWIIIMIYPRYTSLLKRVFKLFVKMYNSNLLEVIKGFIQQISVELNLL